MAIGPGKYDNLATLARKRSGAKGVAVIVMDGKHGHGFSIQVDRPEIMVVLPRLLRDMADQIEVDLKANWRKEPLQ